jgi:aminopeptidase N
LLPFTVIQSLSSMRKAALFLCLVIPAMLHSQETNLNWIDQDALARSSAMSASALKGRLALSQTPSGIDIRFHRILLTLDPAVRFVTGSVSTYFVPKQANLRVITFDMHDSLAVTAIRYHGQLLTSYSRLNNRISVELPDDPSTSPLDSIMIDYQGVPFDDGEGSFAIARHQDAPALYTLSEPYGAMTWWPCSQDLNDKIDSVHLVITVPPGNRAASNGILIAEQHCDDRSIYQWMHRHPIAAYLVAVAVSNYAVYSDWVPVENAGSIEILNYVYPEDSARFRSETPGIIKPFRLLNQWFGLYPFADEKYGHAQWNWGGGMEHQTMSFMGSFGYDLMVHELAHQWFGNFITCRSWGDIWLNEGFATYVVGLCYEADQGGIYWEPFKRLTINRIIKEPGGSVFCYDTTSVARIFDPRLSYSKGAMVLHMLRWEMGDTNFFKMLTNYLNDPLLANGYASTGDLIRHAEAAADTSFREFFNDWVYGEGYPKYELVYRQMTGQELELEISQEQSHPSVSFFEMDLPVRVYGSGGTSSYRDFVVRHTQNGQVFRINPGFMADSVKFDPDRWICTANALVLNAGDIPWERKIRVYPNPVTDLLTIEMTVPEEGLNIRIYNQSGQLVHTGRTSGSTPGISIPVQSFARGVYTVEIEGRQKVTVVKN